MKFDDFANHATLVAVAAAARVAPPTLSELRTARRRRSATSAGFGAFAGTLLIVGAAAWWPTGIPAGPAESVASTVPASPAAATIPATTTTTIAPGSQLRIWSIAQPPSWHRADSELMPNLAWRSVSLATFPLRPGGARCANMPENALRDLGPQDVLLSVFFTGASQEGAPWPVAGFDDQAFPAAAENTDAHECADRPELEVHWGNWENGSEGLYLLAAFGDEVPDHLRQEAWATLWSLRVIDDDRSGRLCVVTVPAAPGLAVPDTHPREPVFGVWHGTPELWTVLEPDGSYGPRKSVWWSANFPGGAIEERPEVLVTWRRIDLNEPIRTNDSIATNAHTVGDGHFMIAGIDPQASGCWEITATYKGATLSYVAAIR